MCTVSGTDRSPGITLKIHMSQENFQKPTDPLLDDFGTATATSNNKTKKRRIIKEQKVSDQFLSDRSLFFNTFTLQDNRTERRQAAVSCFDGRPDSLCGQFVIF